MLMYDLLTIPSVLEARQRFIEHGADLSEVVKWVSQLDAKLDAVDLVNTKELDDLLLAVAEAVEEKLRHDG